MITGQNGKLFWNLDTKRWEDKDGNYGWNHKRVCEKCHKPRLDINGVEDCDFCLQGLTTCDFIDYACCGHGNDDFAYISLKDGRLFVLEQFKDDTEKDEKNKNVSHSQKDTEYFLNTISWIALIISIIIILIMYGQYI